MDHQIVVESHIEALVELGRGARGAYAREVGSGKSESLISPLRSYISCSAREYALPLSRPWELDELRGG